MAGRNSRWHWVYLCCNLVVLPACTGHDSSESLAAAKTFLAKKSDKAAVIELKNALQKSPDLAEARYLLGKAYLASGESAPALVELQRAHDLHFSLDQVLPELARALLQEKQEKRLIDSYGNVKLTDKASQADLQTSLAFAYAAKNDGEKAKLLADAALGLVPNFAPAMRFEAIRLARQGDYDQAISTIDSLLTKRPADVNALHSKGEFLLYGKQDVPGAVAAFRQALTSDPGHVDARVSLITTLLAQRDFEGASRDLEKLRKARPRHPQTAYFDAQLAFFRGDYKRSHEIADQLTRLAPDSVQVRQLAGAVEYQLGLFPEAERSLTRALQLSPELPTSRRLLAQTYLRMGRPAKVLETLAPMLTDATRDGEAASLAAEAHLQLGNLPQARANLAKASAADPRDVRSRVALLLATRRRGHGDDVLTELRALAASDKGTYVDLTLASLYLADKEFDRALRVMEVVDQKLPGQALTANIRGRIYLLQKDVGHARSSFEEALAIDPSFIPAASSLAQLDIAEGTPEHARQRFESVLKADPKNVSAMMALAGMKAKAGASSAEVEGLMRDAIKLNPTYEQPWLVLVDSQLQRRDNKSALASAREAVNAYPTSLAALDALGRAEWAGGDTNQALSTFKKSAALDVKSPTPWLRMGALQQDLRMPEAAIESFNKALVMSPDSQEALRGLVSSQLAAGRPEDALMTARAVKRRHPAAPTGDLIEAGIETTRKRPAAAAEVYRNTLKRFPQSSIASSFYTTLLSASRQPEAEQFASGWLTAHPQDAEFLFGLGEAALARNDYAAAETRFRAVLAIVPDNAAALNNLAWTLTLSGKPGASDYAKRATALVPASAPLWDTLASALAAENRLSEALAAESKAVGLTGSRSAFRVRLAKLHLDAGDKANARKELDTVASAPDRNEVQAQFDALKRRL